MNQKDRFQDLARLSEEKRQENARKKQKEDEETQETYKRFGPLVETVCKEFATAVKWHLRKFVQGIYGPVLSFEIFPDTGGAIADDESEAFREGRMISVEVKPALLPYGESSDTNYPCSVLVLRQSEFRTPTYTCNIEDIEGRKWWEIDEWNESDFWPVVIIPLGTFTEEKLAEALEIVFKKMEGII